MTYEGLKTSLIEADTLFDNGNYDEAERLTQQVLDYIARTNTGNRNDGLLRVRATFLLGAIAFRCQPYPVALQYQFEALKISEANHYPEGTVRAMGNIGLVHHKLCDYTLALEYYGKALALDEELGNKAGVARHLGNIGNVYSDLSDYSLALEYHGKALTLDEELGNKAGVATHVGDLGVVYAQLADYSLALEYFGKALLLEEELGNKLGVAKHLSNIGGAYHYLSNNSIALEYYNKSLSIHEKLGNLSGVARLLGAIGIVQRCLSDFEIALVSYSKALEIDQNLGNKAGVASWLGGIGLVHHSLSDYTLALDYFSKALVLDEELGNKAGVTVWLYSIGATYAKPEFEGYDTEKAAEFLLKSVKISSEIGHKRHLYEVHKNLSELYATSGCWKKSREHFEKFHTIYLEVQSEEATKQAQLMEHRRKIEESERDRQVKLARFQEQEKILHNILPSKIADRMLEGEKTIADSHENVSVFFSDIVGFTTLSQRVSAQELVGMLNAIFTQFDHIAREHGLEKIKTIGDSYMAVCGAPIPVANHAERTALFALEVAEFMKNYQTDSGDKVSVRIGLHTGSVVAGIIGENKFAYDMWGDAVNTASRMESHGEPGKVHVSEEFKHAVETLHATSLQLHATSLQFIRRGEMEIKGKGLMKTYFLENRSKR